jgi:tetratricopeptide (TPR) repeat protein
MPVRDIDTLLAQMKSLMDQGRFSEAIQIGQTLLPMLATGIPANRAYVHYNLGICYDEQERYAEAESEYAESIRENSGDSDTWYNRANNYNRWGGSAYRSGDIAGSRNHFRRAMEYAQKARQLNPTDPDIPSLIAKIMSNLNL